MDLVGRVLIFNGPTFVFTGCNLYYDVELLVGVICKFKDVELIMGVICKFNQFYHIVEPCLITNREHGLSCFINCVCFYKTFNGCLLKYTALLAFNIHILNFSLEFPFLFLTMF
jgi:hypothetical protein